MAWKNLPSPAVKTISFSSLSPPKKLAQIKALKEKGHMVSVIGEVTKGRGVKLFQKGKEIKLTAKGYQHFKGKPHG